MSDEPGVGFAAKRARIAFRDGNIPDKYAIRQLWKGVSECRTEIYKGAARRLLKLSFERFSDTSIIGKRGPNDNDTIDFERHDLPTNEMKAALRDPTNSPLLMFQSGEVVVVTAMVSAFLRGSVTYNALAVIGRPAYGYAFIGYNLWQSSGFFGEGLEPLKISISDQDRQYLSESAVAGKVALLVDDYVKTGKTLRVLTRYLQELGFAQVYQIVGSAVYKISGEDMVSVDVTKQ